VSRAQTIDTHARAMFSCKYCGEKSAGRFYADRHKRICKSLPPALDLTWGEYHNGHFFKRVAESNKSQFEIFKQALIEESGRQAKTA